MVALHHQYIRYAVYEQPHKAGYDAFWTARVFLALTGEMSKHGREKSEDLNTSTHTHREFG